LEALEILTQIFNPEINNGLGERTGKIRT
jgi:hypothetical protein